MRFLRSVSSGDYGGLASYRPGEQATRTMTAEALVCWQFLGMAREDPASNEAGDFLLGQLPGQGAVNVYYWYYGTLAMYQLQGEYWRRWNQALQTQLLGTHAQGRRLGRKLGPRRHLGRLRRPHLQHLAIGPLPGGLLPLPAALFAGARSKARRAAGLAPFRPPPSAFLSPLPLPLAGDFDTASCEGTMN